jgi:hypothetical protein
MLLVALACCVLVVATTMLHYEVLRLLNFGLPRLGVPHRAKVVVVILTAFVAHVAEMALYGAAIYVLIAWFDAGTLTGSTGFSLVSCMYYSAETYTSLGFGDLMPAGPVRLLAGVEALNGLLLIGWSASFMYLAMERFWLPESEQEGRR